MASIPNEAIIERRRQIKKMREAGFGLIEIARALGISKASVHRHIVAIREGVMPQLAVRKQMVAECYERGDSKQVIAAKFGISPAYVAVILSQEGALSTTKGIRVPGWVPSELRSDYIDFARAFDEHYAARQCRRLKAEAA